MSSVLAQKPARGIDFEDLKTKALDKGFSPVYIDRLREHAVMSFMFSQGVGTQASSDQIRVGVAKAFNANVASMGGFSEAYRREREVVKAIGRQLPERKFDETLQLMSVLVQRLEEKRSVPLVLLELAKTQFFAAAKETIEAYKAFKMDPNEILRRVEGEPLLLKHGVAEKVSELINGPSPAKSTLGGLLSRVAGYASPRPGRSSNVHV